jgi:hypothetical protein
MGMWLGASDNDAVRLFWEQCGEIEPFPRNLERPIALALPVTLVKLPRLKLHQIEGWLHRRGVPFQFDCRNRAVRGCLVAFGGAGLIFVDGSDPDDERRFTLAHEIAHFLVDYWRPREKAMIALGHTISEVLDGVRPPTVSERVNALLIRTPIGVHTDLMEREADGDLTSVWQIEDRADKVALALLAPPEEVLSRTELGAGNFEQRLLSITSALRADFGLPLCIAKPYGHSLLSSINRGPSWLETLGLK